MAYSCVISEFPTGVLLSDITREALEKAEGAVTSESPLTSAVGVGHKALLSGCSVLGAGAVFTASIFVLERGEDGHFRVKRSLLLS